jgi:hypothetical protein
VPQFDVLTVKLAAETVNPNALPAAYVWIALVLPQVVASIAPQRAASIAYC